MSEIRVSFRVSEAIVLIGAHKGRNARMNVNIVFAWSVCASVCVTHA